MIRDLLPMLAGFLGRRSQPVPSIPTPTQPTPWNIRENMRAAQDQGTREAWLREAFKPAEPPAWVLPKDFDRKTLPSELANDDASAIGAAYAFAINGQFGEGLRWFGYPYLAELSQRAEFRMIVETIAEEMTRKWITFEYSGTKDKTQRIKDLEGACEKFELRARFRRGEELDGFFGIGHLYVDIAGARDDKDILASPLTVDKRTIKRNSLRGFIPVEPLWTYPANYNADDPLRPDFYRPDAWYVMSKTVHRSRLLTFLSRPMSDILKAAYSFGGMSLTQLAKPAVDFYLQGRNDIGTLINNFSLWVLYTDMSAALNNGGTEFMTKRAEMFAWFRSNSGLFMANKASGADQGEKVENHAVPLTSLPELQQQQAEHIAFYAQEPLVKLWGVTPAGLNASSDGEIRVFYDRINAYQERRWGDKLKIALNIIQLSEFGEIDEDITFKFENLWQLDDAGQRAVDKTEADIDEQNASIGAISPEEVRQRVAKKKGSQYQGLDLELGKAPGSAEVDGEGKPIEDPDTKLIDRESEGAGGGGGHGAASGV